MSTSTHVSTAESSKPESADRSEQKKQSTVPSFHTCDALLTGNEGDTIALPQNVIDPSPGDEECSGEEWETIEYEETAEGRKAKSMASGYFQIKHKKKRLFSYHWNVRKY